MNDPTCTEVHDAAAEYALDILESDQRSAVAAHLLRCPDCRAEVEAVSTVGARLLDLVPGTEPPLGFDRRVLARVRPRRRRGPWPAGRTSRWVSGRSRVLAGVGSLAAAAAVIFGALGGFSGGTTVHPTPTIVTAALVEGTRNVGDVYLTGDRSPWLHMEVHGATGADKVTCELLAKDGSMMRLGSFDLVGGSGSWGAPDRTSPAAVSGVRLVGSTGQVIATAVFRA
jgi:anti-sigma-K factor RskA